MARWTGTALVFFESSACIVDVRGTLSIIVVQLAFLGAAPWSVTQSALLRRQHV